MGVHALPSGTAVSLPKLRCLRRQHPSTRSAFGAKSSTGWPYCRTAFSEKLLLRRQVGTVLAGVMKDDGENEERGLSEAFELLREAQWQAEEQTKAELLQWEAADGDSDNDSCVDTTSPHSASVSSSSSSQLSGIPDILRFGSEAVYPMAVRALQKTLLAQGFSTSDETGRFGLRTEAALKAFQASRGLRETGVVDAETLDALIKLDRQRLRDSPAQIEQLKHFWREEGLSNERAIEKLSKRLSLDRELLTMDALYARLQRLRRLLPEADVLKMASDEVKVLKMDLSLATSNLITLTQALPDENVTALVEAFPRVLLMDDLQHRLLVCVERIGTWSPRSNAARVLADNPSFLHRIPDYYSRADSFSGLPVDIQNSMAVGGGGGGFAFKSWSGFVDNNTD